METIQTLWSQFMEMTCQVWIPSAVGLAVLLFLVIPLARAKGKWKKKYNSAYCEDKNYVHEFFMDKELYSILLHNLEYNDSLNIGALAMLNRSNRIYHTPAMAHRLMKNIVSAYEAAQLDYYRIVQNVKNAIRQLK